MRTVLGSILRRGRAILLAGTAAASHAAIADVRLPAIFSDNMVIQRGTDARVWGWARPGERVKVSLEPKLASGEAVANPNGRWIATLKTPADHDGPCTLQVTGDNAITLRNVWLGEVWVCSGQSNMEWPLAATDDAEREIANSFDPHVRLFMVPNRVSAVPLSDTEGAWTLCTPETSKSFSAVGYYFARELRERLGTRVGLISADWGGTRVEAWCDRTTASSFDGEGAMLAGLDIASNPLRRQTDTSDAMRGWWHALGTSADPMGWSDVGFDDTLWTATKEPQPWSGDLGSFDGVGLMRRTIDLDASWSRQPATLELGPIDDRDETIVNGTIVGATAEDGKWNVPRVYEIPQGVLREGANVLAIRVLDTAGQGGFVGGTNTPRLVRADGVAVPLSGDWRVNAATPLAKLPPMPQATTIGPNDPTALYNGMIAPIAGVPARGFLWYQGESNRGNFAQYAERFPAMIKAWRAHWYRDDMPFYFVQIAPFNYGDNTGLTPRLREAQARALALPATGMAVTLDIGDAQDIHPRNKREVGRRLALLALRNTYGIKDSTPEAPVFASVVTGAGAEIRVRFQGSDAVTLRDAPAGTFLIAGEDRKFSAATARLDGAELVLSSPEVARPIAVRYAWSDTPQAALFGASGLPIPPFRSDDWAP